MVKKYVDLEMVNRQLEKLCNKHNISFGGKQGSLGRDILKFADSLPVVDLPILPDSKKYDKNNFSAESFISSPTKQTKLKVIWMKPPMRNYFVWVCRYGNIVTQSVISPKRCFEMHIKKLQSNGIDTSKFDEEPIIIQKSEVI